VDFFRGRGRFAEALDRLLEADEVVLCGPVITELRRGLRSGAERTKVLRCLEGCHVLEQPSRLWEEAGELGYFLGRRGTTIKSLDLMIATYALAYSIAILTRDSDFKAMKRAGLNLLLAEP
jgi:predicted nucleic acid-binding protein